MGKANLEFRIFLLSNGIKQCELANALGIHRAALCRTLKKELPQEKKIELYEVASKLIAQRK